MSLISTLESGLHLKSLEGESADPPRRFVLFHGKDKSHWGSTYRNGAHPTVTDVKILVVVEPASHEVVSSLVLILQTWRYETIDLTVGRIELVKTDRAYRRLGLMRALVEAAHDRADLIGHDLQIIWGILGFYGRFGYTQTIPRGQSADLATGSIKTDRDIRFSLRPASSGDAEFLVSIDDHVSSRYAVTSPRDARVWNWEIGGRPARKRLVSLIVDSDGSYVG